MAVLPQARARWPLAFALALGAHVAVAGFVALKPGVPPAPEPPPPPPALMLDLAPPAPPVPPPPPPKPMVQAPAPKPPPVMERAAAKLPPPPKQKLRPQPAAEPPQQLAADPAPTTAPMADAAASARPAPPSGPPPDAMAAFQGRLMAHLGKHKRYPMGARQRRQQGTAWVRLTMDRQGRLLSHRLERGCGVELLDREAEELLARAQPLPEIPAELGQEQMELVLPVEFSLR